MPRQLKQAPTHINPVFLVCEYCELNNDADSRDFCLYECKQGLPSGFQWNGQELPQIPKGGA